MLQGMADALPSHQKGDDSSDLASSYEAVALLVHAYLAAIGFKLRGFDEEKNIRTCIITIYRVPSIYSPLVANLPLI